MTFVDDDPQPRASITQTPSEVDEGDTIEIELTIDRATPVPIGVWIAITDGDGALSGTQTRRTVVFAAFETVETTTFTAADNSTMNDGARNVTFALTLRPDEDYTLKDPSTVTVTVIRQRHPGVSADGTHRRARGPAGEAHVGGAG